MNYLFFDTETSGLPLNYKSPYTDINNWPRLLQLAWILSDENGNLISEADHIIKVDFDIPKDASQIHGITNQVSSEKGVDLNFALDHFLNTLAKADQIVCHNVAFDLAILQSELLRANKNHTIDLPQFCTMKNSTHICKIQGPYGYKWPKLEELYQVCFGTKLEQAHNAKVDIQATHDVFYFLKKKKLFN